MRSLGTEEQKGHQGTERGGQRKEAGGGPLREAEQGRRTESRAGPCAGRPWGVGAGMQARPDLGLAPSSVLATPLLVHTLGPLSSATQQRRCGPPEPQHKTQQLKHVAAWGQEEKEQQVRGPSEIEDGERTGEGSKEEDEAAALLRPVSDGSPKPQGSQDMAG